MAKIIKITLAGLGELEDDVFEDIKKLAGKYKVEFYATYYDHELKGNIKSIEKITMELWGMPMDQWADNNFIKTII